MWDEGGGGAFAWFDAGFDDESAAGGVGVCAEFHHFCLEESAFEEGVDAFAFESGDGDADGVAAPVFGHETVFLELGFDAVDVGGFEVGLIDGDDDFDACGFGVGDGLLGLGHDAVVGGDDEDDDVGDVGTAGAHGGEGGVAGGIEDGDAAAVEVDGVGSDVLGDAAGFACGDLGFTDAVDEAGFAVIDVAHEGDDGGAWLESFDRDEFFFRGGGCDDDFFDFVDPAAFLAFFAFEVEAVFFADSGGDFGFDGDGGIGEDVEFHQVLDEDEDLDAHAVCEVADDDGRFDGDDFVRVAEGFGGGGKWGWRWLRVWRRISGRGRRWICWERVERAAAFDFVIAVDEGEDLADWRGRGGGSGLGLGGGLSGFGWIEADAFWFFCEEVEGSAFHFRRGFPDGFGECLRDFGGGGTGWGFLSRGERGRV